MCVSLEISARADTLWTFPVHLIRSVDTITLRTIPSSKNCSDLHEHTQYDDK